GTSNPPVGSQALELLSFPMNPGGICQHGPYQVLLTTTFALKIAEKDSLIHHTHVKRAPPNFTSQDTETRQHPDTSLKFISEQQY
uniref:Uncharacterized protein n=1 Tax=Pelusios castaneus TaxID=367368 RepID=A0A8C8S1T9_9SAUR